MGKAVHLVVADVQCLQGGQEADRGGQGRQVVACRPPEVVGISQERRWGRRVAGPRWSVGNPPPPSEAIYDPAPISGSPPPVVGPRVAWALVTFRHARLRRTEIDSGS